MKPSERAQENLFSSSSYKKLRLIENITDDMTILRATAIDSSVFDYCEVALWFFILFSFVCFRNEWIGYGNIGWGLTLCFYIEDIIVVGEVQRGLIYKLKIWSEHPETKMIWNLLE